MKSRKTLDNIMYTDIVVTPLFDDNEIQKRHNDYINLSNKAFDEEYRERAFTPVIINYGNKEEFIQYNFCSDPFCPNYAEPLEILIPRGFRSIKNYMFKESKETPMIRCNIMKHLGANTHVDNNYSTLMSNWSIAEEIKRLEVLNRVVDEQVDYIFHETNCTETLTPFDKNSTFVKYGKTSAGSTRYKCKSCGKVTAIKPSERERQTYHQQRSDVTLSIFEDIISRVPVRKICEKNKISPSTFYAKVNTIYMKCLAFLERHESKLTQVQFNDLYITSDSFMYSLNNIRKKGKGGTKQTKQEKANANEAITYMIASGDVNSAYVFRADVCYDTFISLTDIQTDTEMYHCDHTFPYLRKNDRIRNFSYMPQSPTLLDSESQYDYLDKCSLFEARDNFVEGLHTQQNYTNIAHMHLIKKILNAKRYVFVTDDDGAIKQAIFKVYADKFKELNAYYFTSQYDKTLGRQEAFEESAKARRELNQWVRGMGLSIKGLYEKAIEKVAFDIHSHDFHKHQIINGKTLFVAGSNLYLHPLPAVDEGKRYINLISPSNGLFLDELAEMIVIANTRTIDNFFQEIRRHLNLLERPLVGARGTGKTYIYSNYNPKYAQQLVTIYRTYYNFIKPRKYFNQKKKDMTPAMRIGIVNKKYELKDIVYFV